MAVRIRLARHGRLHRPFFRLVAIEGRNAREGATLEVLGTYDPLQKEKCIQVDLASVQAWLAKGASISDGLRSLLKVHGYALPSAPATAPKTKRAGAKAAAKKALPKKGEKQPFVAASRRAKLKHAAKKKVEWKAKVAAAAEAKKAEAPAAEAPKA